MYIFATVLPDLWFHFRNCFDWKISLSLSKWKQNFSVTANAGSVTPARKGRKTLKLQVEIISQTHWAWFKKKKKFVPRTIDWIIMKHYWWSWWYKSPFHMSWPNRYVHVGFSDRMHQLLGKKDETLHKQLLYNIIIINFFFFLSFPLNYWFESLWPVTTCCLALQSPG